MHFENCGRLGTILRLNSGSHAGSNKTSYNSVAQDLTVCHCSCSEGLSSSGRAVEQNALEKQLGKRSTA